MKFALRGQTRFFRFYFYDETGTLTDMEKVSAEVYDPEGNLYSTIPSVPKVAAGTYEVSFDVPSDAKIGRWEIVCTGTLQDNTFKDSQAFKVTDFHVPDVNEVRSFLGNLSESLISDSVIEHQINVAYTKVLSERSSKTTKDLLEEATLAVASYYSYLAYASRLERGPGAPAREVREQLNVYEDIADRLLQLVRRGVPEVRFPAAATESLWETVTGGEER